MHEDEIIVDEQVVRRLVDRDVPRFRGRSLRRFAASGSSNVLFLLGEDHLVRLPRQPGGSRSIDTETRWLGQLAPQLSGAVPEVVAVGRPGFGYPERWTVTRWIDGNSPAAPEPSSPASDVLARDLAGFIQALQRLDVSPDAAVDPSLRSYRGGSLRATSLANGRS